VHSPARESVFAAGAPPAGVRDGLDDGARIDRGKTLVREFQRGALAGSSGAPSTAIAPRQKILLQLRIRCQRRERTREASLRHLGASVAKASRRNRVYSI